MVKEVDRMHSKGRPVLVGTTSVEQSESLAAELREQGKFVRDKKYCITTFC